MSSKIELFKVQMPIGGDMSMMLIYNRSRKITRHLPITEKVRDYMKGSLKEFVWGEFTNTGDFIIHMKADWQRW